MGFKLADLVVDIGANLDPLDKGLRRAQTMIRTAMAGAGLFGVSAIFKDAALAAADFGETISKSRFVFKETFGEFTKFADALAGMGIVKKDIYDAASSFALLFKNIGYTSEATLGLTKQMVQIAVDAQSIFDVPFDYALTKIHAGLVGQSRPLREWGVIVDENAVKAEALRLNLQKVGNEFTAQSKVTARASLIMKGLSIAAGDFARTMNQPKMELKRFAADLQNFKVEFGNSLLGPMSEAIRLLREMGSAMKDVTADIAPGGIGGGEFFSGILGGARGILAAGRQGFNDPTIKATGMLGSYARFWNASLAGVRQAFAPDQNLADQLAGVQKGGKAAPAAANFAGNPVVEAMRRGAFAREGAAFNSKQIGKEFASGLKEALQTVLGRGAALGGMFSGNRMEQMLASQALGQGGGAKLIRGLVGGVRSIAENVQGREPFEPAIYSSGREYGRAMQMDIMAAGERERQRKIAAATEKASTTLDQILEAFKEALKRALPAGAS